MLYLYVRNTTYLRHVLAVSPLKCHTRSHSPFCYATQVKELVGPELRSCQKNKETAMYIPLLLTENRQQKEKSAVDPWLTNEGDNY